MKLDRLVKSVAGGSQKARWPHIASGVGAKEDHQASTQAVKDHERTKRLAEEDQNARILGNSSLGVTVIFAVSSYLRRPVEQTKLGER